MSKNIVNYLTFTFLVFGIVLASVWLLLGDEINFRFEPALTVIGLFATITGIFAERQASNYERRRELMIAVYRELLQNRAILSQSEFSTDLEQAKLPIIFPRILVSATEAAIVSGAFTEQKHRNFFQNLILWRDTVNSFNSRLYITEIRTFVNPELREIRSFYNGLMESNRIQSAISLLNSFIDLIEVRHLKDADTSAFKQELSL